MEKKLQVKHKTGFLFNFRLDGDGDDAREEGDTRGGANAGERGAFRFAFNPCVDTGATGASKGASGGGANPPIARGFVVTRKESTGTTSAGKKKKAANKKKKKGKGRGKGSQKSDPRPVGNPRDQVDVPEPPIEGTAECLPSPTVSCAGYATNDALSIVAASDSSLPQGTVQQPDAAAPHLAQPDARQRNLSTAPMMARPPPGLTLESWKDPALTAEERRRRRFGRGVRNMVAIQRSRDSRRGVTAEEGLVGEDVTGSPGGVVRPDPSRDLGAAGGSSVFAFGFDIGISFNGGS